jgi:RNA polymerase sigma factor (sigma-70 family)
VSAAVQARNGGALGGLGEVAELYAGSAGQVRRLVRSEVRASEPVIEDACQFAWSRLVHHRERVCREAAVSWLVTTAMREAFKLMRRDRRDLSLESVMDGTGDLVRQRNGPSAEEVMEHRARLEALRSLSERQQRLVWLQGFGLSYAEMAEQTGATTRTIERQILRARHKLRLAEPDARLTPDAPA